MDAAQPAHRREFAGRLRDLRRECGQPAYRVLGTLAHCSYTSLSEAAAGRRLPSWETARGYVTACLRHAGRQAEIDRLLPQWRRAWEQADVRERAHRPEPPPPAGAPSLEPPRPVASWRRPAAVVLVVVALLASLAGAAATSRAPAPMTGRHNILVVPFQDAPALQRTVVHELESWSARDGTVAVRGPGGVEPARREAALRRLAGEHRADIAVTGRLHTSGDSWTLVIDVVLTHRVLSETPGFVGSHELHLTEPADVVRGNVEVSRQLADDAVRYVKAVVAVRESRAAQEQTGG
ncbi:hypothetical protein AB0F81_16075 [Actinoplanes sp. NPDC024001]|uniref:hypothetical protein n=1 Tax=Actinoplanes sp. NPDC024001 TaxID=3154598 RepID=UPI0033EFD25B